MVETPQQALTARHTLESNPLRTFAWIAPSRPNICFKDGYKATLQGNYAVHTGLTLPSDVHSEFIHLRMDGLLVVDHAYPWDFASGPTWDSREHRRASLVHDALCQLIFEGLIPWEPYRKLSDKVFLRLIFEDIQQLVDAKKFRRVRATLARARARGWYRALRIGGRVFSSKEAHPTRSAPC